MSTETEGEEGGKQPDLNEMLEMSKKAAWSVSSFKPGNGVELLRDDNLDTYWQSDGAQPHSVNVQFQRKVKLQLLAIYVNFKHDESYTPGKISVRVGNGFHDLREIKTLELLEPIGWTYISLCSNESREPFIQTYMLQLAIITNHQNGRDTHIRQMKIYGPRPNLVPREDFQFSSLEFTMFSTIR